MEVYQLLICWEKFKSGACINELKASDFANVVIVEYIFINFIVIIFWEICAVSIERKHTRGFEFRNDSSNVVIMML